MKSAAPKLTFRTYSRAEHSQLPATIRLPTELAALSAREVER